MFKSITTKTLYSLRWQFTGWLIAVFFIAFITMILYPSFSQNGIEEIVNSVPESLKSLVGNVADFKTIPGYIGQQIFGPNLYIISIVMSILLFTAISANEESDGRMQSLLSLPVSRARVYLEKYFATMLIVVVISISAIIAIWISLVILHESVDYWRVWQSIIGFSVLNLAYGTIAYVAAMFTGSKGWTLLLASGYAVVSLFVSTLAPAVDKLAPFDKLSLIHYYNNPQIMTNGLSVSDIGIQLFVILVLLAVGLVGFVKRDIKAN